MTRSADELVTEFCTKWSMPDPDELAGYFAEDGVYHNIPMDAVHGREAIKQFIAGFLAGFDGIDFQVHRQVSDGSLVMNERTDVMRRKDGEPIPLPVTGVFEIEDGQIKAWRDYFDMATITRQFG
jgi:limonene-1,2-epoxide hydrolase